MAHKGHDVTGVDLNPAYVAALTRAAAGKRTGPGPDDSGESRAAHRNSGLPRCGAGTDVTFIMVPTFRSDGGFSMKYVLDSAEQIGGAADQAGLAPGGVSSTVMPGSTGGTLLPALEAHSGKKCGTVLAVLQPRIHRAGQRGPGHAESGHDPDRRIGRRRASWRSCTWVCDSNPQSSA